ncbi:uncharacterized protein LOC122397122 isoform X1 [Colletes gigas]|uniref:uncharacterized protein LOC122397122 isoform X1 n=1 Tax=Colletes gigas TaxID=935657 RepID=UPI001C9AAE3D|nr:uncharacterized protein LOC122397122 isoform X1 [Colletes gigas]XP_043251959.1 uncharacterized protein LOC122397122 isoform X1 [Colletes gigas]XP_043251960.1 uncharacterized protein LOC122397122 isoform X1 [Colletes gigas]
MILWTLCCLNVLTVSVLCRSTGNADKSGWNFDPNTQYHIQTDEGPERHFRFQTLNGQYRKEKRLVDGTVIGTEGWLDPLGYLRLKDYVADHNGFRILRSKMVYVGKDRPMYDAMAEAKRVPAQSGILVEPTPPPNPFRQWKGSNVSPLLGNEINSGYYVSTTANPRVDVSPISSSSNDYYNAANRGSFSSGQRNLQNSQLPNNYYNYHQRPRDGATGPYNHLQKNHRLATPASQSSSTDAPPYDGTHTVANGFQYYLKRQYHEEEQDARGGNVGSFGYIDPFGIRRVIYYKTDPQSNGFVHQKNNKYVGFAATPYDPSPPTLYRQRSRRYTK